MTLRVIEQAGLSDVGRQREANEDSYVIAPPFFVVADGMGGARAGEVASRLAAEAFRDAAADAGGPERTLAALAQEANGRIFELSREDESRRGMGTTLTATMVTPDGVSVGHVGDSRAYRLRGGELEQLTHDHSLVAELERSGQLTREAAEHHPQRSIITRALGPEPRVEVDTHTHNARDGDVYLLCSDGLTTMISDADVASILRAAGSLQDAAESLVRAANQSGGKDNVTVVLFRLGDDGEAPAHEPPSATSATIHQGLTADDVQAAVDEQERAGARTVAPATAGERRAGRPARRRRGRGVLAAIAALLVLAVLAGGAVLAARQVWFVGTDGQGLVSLYRGLPYDLPLGVRLYSLREVSGVPARSLPRARRERLLDHRWRSRSDAEDLLRQLERGTLDGGGRGG